MKYTDIGNITLRQMQIFLAAARCGNFSRAAQQLNVTQPLVSRTVAVLEQEIGYPLFTRVKKQVVLNPAGQVLLHKWEGIFSFIEQSLESGSLAYDRFISTLAVAADPAEEKDRFFLPVIEAFSKTCPGVTLRMDQLEPEAAANSILAGSLDAAFTMLPELSRLEGKGFQWEILREGCYTAEVPEQSPLYAKESLSLEELADEPITLISAGFASNYSSAVMDMFLSRGLRPRQMHYVSSTQGLELARTTGSSIVIGTEFVFRLKDSKNRVIPIRDSRTALLLFWKEGAANPNLPAFIETARRVLAQGES